MDDKEKKRLKELLKTGIMFNKIQGSTMDEIMELIDKKENTIEVKENFEFIRPKQIAMRLNCSIDNARKLLAAGKIKKIAISPRVIGTTKEALIQFIKERGQNNATNV